jgi:hypothetical protein
VELGFWWRFKFADSAQNPLAALGLYTNKSASRNIYLNSVSSYQDNGSTLVMTAQTDNLDQGTSKRKSVTSAELVCDSQATSGNISISWSDDDYATFSTARTIDPSTGTRRITRLGSTKRNNNNRRAWKIEETVNRPFSGTELVLEYAVGLS